MNDSEIFARIENLIKHHRVVLYMKGTPEFPRCGFSKDVADVLNHLGVHFVSVDVLEDSLVREGIKKYAQWPTIPQLYVDGELVGGCDIIMSMYRDGSLLKLISVS